MIWLDLTTRKNDHAKKRPREISTTRRLVGFWDGPIYSTPDGTLSIRPAPPPHTATMANFASCSQNADYLDDDAVGVTNTDINAELEESGVTAAQLVFAMACGLGGACYAHDAAYRNKMAMVMVSEERRNQCLMVEGDENQALRKAAEVRSLAPLHPPPTSPVLTASHLPMPLPSLRPQRRGHGTVRGRLIRCRTAPSRSPIGTGRS